MAAQERLIARVRAVDSRLLFSVSPMPQSPMPKRPKPMPWMLILAAICIFPACSVFCFPSWPVGRSLQSRIPQRVRPELKKKAMRGKRLVGQDRGTVAKQKALTTEINRCTSVSSLLQVVEGSDLKIDELDGICLSAFINMIGRLRKTIEGSLNDSQPFRQILDRSCKHLRAGNIEPRFVSTALWASAAARKEAPELQALLPPTIGALDGKVVDGMGAQSSVTSLWAIATLHTYTEGARPILQASRVCDLLVPRIIEVKDDLNSQNLNNAVWSIARLPRSVSLRDKLLPVIMFRCRDFLENDDRVKLDARYKPSGLANLVWALSLLDYKDKQILDYVSRTYLEAAEDFQDIGHLASYIDVLCAFAKLKVADDPLADATARLPWKLSLLRDWDLCALTWAYQQLDPTRRLADFQRKLQKEVTRRKLTQKDVDESRHGYEEWDSRSH